MYLQCLKISKIRDLIEFITVIEVNNILNKTGGFHLPLYIIFNFPVTLSIFSSLSGPTPRQVVVFAGSSV